MNNMNEMNVFLEYKEDEMRKCENCDPFEHYDALVILTRQGCVMTSNDAQLTFVEDAQLYKLNKVIADRTRRANEEEERARKQWKALSEALGFEFGKER